MRQMTELFKFLGFTMDESTGISSLAVGDGAVPLC